MKLRDYIVSIFAAALLALWPAGVLGAECVVSETGANAAAECVQTDENSVKVSNSNDISVGGSNSQNAHSGTAESVGNTQVNGGQSGAAANDNAAATDVSIGVSPVSVPDSEPEEPISPEPVAPVGGGVGGGGIGAPGAGPSGGVGGGVLPGLHEDVPAGVGGGLLPETGPSGIMDVSALRNLPAVDSDSKRTSPAMANLFGVLALLGFAAGGGLLRYAHVRGLISKGVLK